jgi:hypothetical protein
MYNILLTVKINNQDASELVSKPRISSNYFTITWDPTFATYTSVSSTTGALSDTTAAVQDGYEIRISDIDYNFGSDDFIGNKINTGYIDSENEFWEYDGAPLERSKTYYGQIYIKDSLGRSSLWQVFYFVFGGLPSVSDVLISPATASVNDNLELSYTFSGGWVESGSKIRWFKDGVQQFDFDDILIVESNFLQNGDTWAADILPSDGYEYGKRVQSQGVIVSRTSVQVSDATILPLNPNVDDILKAVYGLSDVMETENVVIRWFINDLVKVEFDNKIYIRPDVVPGDKVRYEIRHLSSSSFVSSSEITVVESNFVPYGLLIDGQEDPLDLSVFQPVIKWNVYTPYGRVAEYVSIKIGSFYGADDIYSTVIQTRNKTFKVPHGTLVRGRDYYVSLLVSDTNGFSNSDTGIAHFRTVGSTWEESVSNVTGWTFETSMMLDRHYGTFTDDSFSSFSNSISFYDGSKWGEVKLYGNKITFSSGSETELEYEHDFLLDNFFNIITIVGIGDDLKVYLNREIVINGTSMFNQVTSDKKIEVRSSSTEFIFDYKYFFYSINGAYYPDASSEYSNYYFYKYLNFKEAEVSDLTSYIKDYTEIVDQSTGATNSYSEEQKLLSINPKDKQNGGSIFAIIPEEAYKTSANSSVYNPVNNEIYYAINSSNVSPDGKTMVFAHSEGFTIINGSYIYGYDYDIEFIDSNDQVNEVYPQDDGWTLVRNVGSTAAYFDSDGFNIDTTIS